jgi:hypothetical protein
MGNVLAAGGSNLLAGYDGKVASAIVHRTPGADFSWNLVGEYD